MILWKERRGREKDTIRKGVVIKTENTRRYTHTHTHTHTHICM
jgi:hypothetical protein